MFRKNLIKFINSKNKSMNRRDIYEFLREAKKNVPTVDTAVIYSE